MFYDVYKTKWELAHIDGDLVSCSDSRDTVLSEGITKDEAVSLAQQIKRPSEIINWVRIPI